MQDDPPRLPKPPIMPVLLAVPSPSRDKQPKLPSMDEVAKEELLKTVATKVGRLDSEIDIVVDQLRDITTNLRGVRNDLGIVSSDVRQLMVGQGAIKEILGEILARLPEPESRPATKPAAEPNEQGTPVSEPSLDS